MKKLFSLLAIATLTLVSCGKNADTAAAGTETKTEDKTVVKIGFIGPLTGGVAQYGIATKEGVELRIEEINAQGGINGKKLELITVDDKGDAKEAVNAYKKLVSNDKVDMIIGAVTSVPSNAIAELAEKDKMPMITPTGTNIDITGGKKYVYRTTFTDPFQGAVMGRYATAKGFKKIAVLTNKSDDYSTGLSQSFIEEAKKSGAEIIENSYTKEDKDFKSILTNIKNANVDAIYIPDYYETIGLIATQAKELGINAQFLGGDGWDGVQTNFAAVTDGALFVSQYAANDESPLVQNFIKAYNEKYKKDPILFAALGYDTVEIIANALKTAKDSSADSLIEAFKATDLDLVTGKLVFDENNDPKKIADIIEIKDGKLTLKEKAE